MFARVYQSITAGVEAPLQTVMTLYLMATSNLRLPWEGREGGEERKSLLSLKDNAGNDLDFNLPAVSMFFSVSSMIKCAIAINIFIKLI